MNEGSGIRSIRARSALALALLLAASACTGSGARTTDATGENPRYANGGTLRVASQHFTYDPQKSYFYNDWELLRCCLVRTLFTFSGRPTAEGGAILRPDLANGMGSISADGLTWAFELKTGIHFGPPFQDREITAADIARALEREADPEASEGGYSFYYAPIEGFDEFRAGTVDSISGIDVPDDHTLVVHLTQPAGDLPCLFAMPATAPIPAGAAQGHDDDYERFLVASGPYMFEGSQDLDFTLPPSEQVPVTGYAPHRGSAILVRDPSWKPGTDAIRRAVVDRIEVVLYGFDDDDQSRRDRLAHLERGELDVLLGDSLTPEEVQRYRADPGLVGGVVAAQVSGVSWLDLNLGMPPFDDLHVRRAILYAIDRDEIVRAVGRTFWGFSELAEHLAPDSLEGELLGAYDPYPEHGGDLEAATREMAESAYDHDGDGRCDDPACRSVPIVGLEDYTERSSDEAFLVMRSLQAIGIRLDVRLAPDRFAFGELFATGKYAMAIEIDNMGR